MKSQTTVEEVVRNCYDAYNKRDRAGLEAVIADDFHFTSPLDNQINRQTYFEICWPNSETIIVLTLQHVAVIGDKAFVTYEGLKRDGQRFRNTELLTVKDGKISEVEVYFGWNVPHDVPAGAHKDGA
ncbi:MAG: nuclear transport factor 2 family protein [Cytophagales bacterium]|nr:nuclear transport factor 2 family protein [Rhizobacter sp.]